LFLAEMHFDQFYEIRFHQHNRPES
jgi:hypothetical protein